MSNITERICEQVKIPDVLRRYGLPEDVRRRIPCPIHNGQDKNFCYTDEVYHCWSCGAKGNVVGLVMGVFGLSFKSAVVKLNVDFNLGLLGRPVSAQDRQIEAEQRHVKRAIERLEEENRQDYMSLAALHATLYRYTLYNPEDFEAEQIRTSLEKWLDENIEEVLQPWRQ